MHSTTGRPTRFAALAVTLSLGACATLPFAGLPPAVAPSAPIALAREPGARPVVSSGRAGLPIMAFDPGIYVDAEGYHLFYTSLFCQTGDEWAFSWDPAAPAACNIGTTIGSIAYAFSADRGLTWEFRATPVILPADTGFDASKIETAQPFRRGDTLYLVYSAEGKRDGATFTLRYQIGLARLPLGGRSVRTALIDQGRRFEHRRQPLLPYDVRPGRFDNNVQEPSVVLGPDGLVLYYVGLGLRLPDQPVTAPGQQITSVGLGRAELAADFTVTSRSDATLLNGANITEIRYFDGAYHLFGTTAGRGEFHLGNRIEYATSTDGLGWTAPKVILEGSVPGYDDWGIMAPTVVVEPDRLVVFYTAFGSEERACFPVPADGRFGRPVRDGAACLYATVGRAVAARPGAQPR